MQNTFAFLCVACLCSTLGFSQDKLEDWQANATWSEGTVVVSDGETLKGQVCFNDMEGILLYRNGDKQKVFSARNVLSFTFFDPAANSQRRFYSLEYEDPTNNIKHPLFFELLKEFKRFAILIKKDPVVFNQQKGESFYSENSMKDSNGVMRAQQTETIYFMNTNGLIEPYLELEVSHINGVFNERVKNKKKVIDDDLPKKYFGAKAYEKLLAYARENDLKIKRKEDFLIIVAYYEKTFEK